MRKNELKAAVEDLWVKSYNGDALVVKRKVLALIDQLNEPVETKGNRALADREWTDDEDRLWRLLDFGYSTPSDIRLQLRLGVKFDTTEYVFSSAPVEPEAERVEMTENDYARMSIAASHYLCELDAGFGDDPLHDNGAMKAALSTLTAAGYTITKKETNNG